MTSARFPDHWASRCILIQFLRSRRKYKGPPSTTQLHANEEESSEESEPDEGSESS